MDRFCELLLPVAFSPSPDIYRFVLMNWIKTGFPGAHENFAIAFVDAAMEKFPSLSATRHKRHQPSFNSDKDRAWVYKALQTLRYSLCRARATNRKSIPTYASLVGDLTKICGIGGLLGQQLVAVAAIVGAIPTSYATQAVTCRGTKTARRLEENGFLCATMCQSLLSYVSAVSGMNTACTENCTCEFGRPPNHPYVDVVYVDQNRILFVEATLSQTHFHENAYNVSELRRSNPGHKFTRCQLLLSLDHDLHTLRYGWWAYNPVRSETHPSDGSIVVRVVSEQKREKNAMSKKLRNNNRASSRVRLHGRWTRNQTPFGIPQHHRQLPRTESDLSPSETDRNVARYQRLFELLEDDDSVTSQWEREDRAAERSEDFDNLKDAFRHVVLDDEYSNRLDSRHLRDLHRSGKMRHGTLRSTHAMDNSDPQNLFPSDTVLMSHIDRPVLEVSLSRMAANALGELDVSKLVVEVRMVSPYRFAATAHYNGMTYIHKDRRFALKQHLASAPVDGTNDGAVCHYTKRKSARRAMYFFLFTKIGDPRRWLSQSLHKEDWFGFATGTKDTFPTPANSKQFVVLGSNQGRGSTFAVLCRAANAIHINLVQQPYTASQVPNADRFPRQATAFRLCDCPYTSDGVFKIRKKRRLPTFVLTTSIEDCVVEESNTRKQLSNTGMNKGGWNVVSQSNAAPDENDLGSMADLPQAVQKYWPHGWERITRIRGRGNGRYHCWKSPAKGKVLRSKVSLRKFLDALVEYGGDEDRAYDSAIACQGKKRLGKRTR
jgi:hypothetical protein